VRSTSRWTGSLPALARVERHDFKIKRLVKPFMLLQSGYLFGSVKLRQSFVGEKHGPSVTGFTFIEPNDGYMIMVSGPVRSARGPGRR
jgi:hypothetical protein